MNFVRRVIRTILSRSSCLAPMAEPKANKRNRAQKRNQQAANENLPIDNNDNRVFDDPPQSQPQQQKLAEATISTPNTTIEIMPSNPPRPASTASSGASTASNQNASTANKKQPAKLTTPVPSANEASASSEASEITEKPVQRKPTGPPATIEPKPQLSRTERREIQEAQRAAKAQKKPGTPGAKPNEATTVSAVPKRLVNDHPPSSAAFTTASGSHRPHSEAGDSVLSTISRTVRPLSTASTAVTTAGLATQSQFKKQQKKLAEDRVTLFAHLPIYTRELERLPLTSESKLVHPAIVKLGLQYASRQIVGSNFRCVAFLVAIQKMLEDYQGPPGSTDSSILDPLDLNTKLKANINFLTKCRPNAVTMGTAIRYLKTHIERIPRDITNEKAKALLNEVILSFLREKIELSGVAIAETYAITKITNGDVILIFGYSSLITRILETASQRKINFRVIIVDSRPQLLGLRSARKLLAMNIKCTYVLINAVPFIISEVTKVLLGAHGLLGNGYVMSQVGTAQISLIAKTHNVPVLVCCETYKFCERVQTDSFVINELGDPNDLTADYPVLRAAMSLSSSTENIANSNLNILNMTYDVTPPTFISAVITELGILPCTSVAVVIRMQNKQLDDICAQDQFLSTATTSSTKNAPLESIQ